MCIPESSSGLVGKVDGERGRYRRYEEGALWHCVFINRGNKRFWARPHHNNMMPRFAWRYPEKGLTLQTDPEIEECVKLHTGKINYGMDPFLDFKDSEEKEQWLEAFREAVRMYYLESDHAVLKRCQDLGMTGDGELVPASWRTTSLTLGLHCPLGPRAVVLRRRAATPTDRSCAVPITMSSPPDVAAPSPWTCPSLTCSSPTPW